MKNREYPEVKDKNLVGTYPALVKSGGGYVWDDVLEYGVWCYPNDGAPDIEDGDDYYYVFDCYEESDSLRSHFATLKKRGAHSKYTLSAFTEHGILQLSNVLKSQRAKLSEIN